MTGARLGLIAALAAVVGAGCRRRPPPARDAAPVGDAAAAPVWRPPVAVLDDVAITVTGAADGAVESRELGRLLARCLIEHGDDVVALDRQVEPARAPRHVRLAVELGAATTVDPADPPHIVVTFASTLIWTDDDALPRPTANLVGEASIIGGDADAAVLAVTERLRAEVCRVLAARLDRLAAPDLVAGLADPDPEAVAWTLAVIAARRPPGVLDAVIALLDRPPPIGDAVITTLVALRDPRAVTALTDRVDLADRAQLLTIIEATIALGGPDADDFLRVLTAHADPGIAGHAQAGLARLQRTAAPAD